MRDLAMMVGFLAMLAPMFRHPHVGVLVWCWTAMVVPTYFVFGFMSPVPFNKVAAAMTLTAWLISREPKRIPLTSTMVLLAVFGVLGTVSAFAGIANSDLAMTEWSKFAKIMVFVFVVVGLITTKSRIDALLYAIYVSLGFHGVLEGAKFVMSAGGHQVYGPPSSIINDNNHFALAMVATLPIVLYLYRQTEHRLVRLALLGSSLLVMLSIMGTYSRGGLIGIAAVGAFALMRSENKGKYLLAVLPVAVLGLIVAPDRWFNRMDTLGEVGMDESFMTRVVAWKLSALIAMDHPVLGGGFHAVQDFDIWRSYSAFFDRLSFIATPPPSTIRSHAAHSIYFQVLGDLGFLGLTVFIAILVSSWRNAKAIIRSAGDRPEWRWARDLATSLQYTLVAYIVSGASLSMAYFEFIYMIFAVLVVMREMVGEPVVAKRWTQALRAA